MGIATESSQPFTPEQKSSFRLPIIPGGYLATDTQPLIPVAKNLLASSFFSEAEDKNGHNSENLAKIRQRAEQIISWSQVQVIALQLQKLVGTDKQVVNLTQQEYLDVENLFVELYKHLACSVHPNFYQPTTWFTTPNSKFESIYLQEVDTQHLAFSAVYNYFYQVQILTEKEDLELNITIPNYVKDALKILQKNKKSSLSPDSIFTRFVNFLITDRLPNNKHAIKNIFGVGLKILTSYKREMVPNLDEKNISLYADAYNEMHKYIQETGLIDHHLVASNLAIQLARRIGNVEALPPYMLGTMMLIHDLGRVVTHHPIHHAIISGEMAKMLGLAPILQAEISMVKLLGQWTTPPMFAQMTNPNFENKHIGKLPEPDRKLIFDTHESIYNEVSEKEIYEQQREYFGIIIGLLQLCDFLGKMDEKDGQTSQPNKKLRNSTQVEKIIRNQIQKYQHDDNSLYYINEGSVMTRMFFWLMAEYDIDKTELDLLLQKVADYMVEARKQYAIVSS